ncbi:MAG TPA: rod shape-determining protein MreC [Chloroflexota bacterium]|nr:rod shape-determining protein MreC [Chloroflexota bacterium]
MRQGVAEPKSSRRLVVALLAAAIALLIAGPHVQPVESALSVVLTPVQSVVSTAVDDVTGMFSSLRNLPTLESQNRALRRQNALLVREIALRRDQGRENAQLSQALHYRDLNPTMNLTPARVIDESMSGFGSSVGINAGSAEGVAAGDPVVDPDLYLVGQVTQVWRERSTVMLITDPHSHVLAIDNNSAAQGLVSTPYGGTPQFGFVSTGEKMSTGDVIETSGMKNLFPIGLIIGQLTHVATHNVASVQAASLKTGADLNNLQLVQVIRDWSTRTPARYFARRKH